MTLRLAPVAAAAAALLIAGALAQTPSGPAVLAPLVAPPVPIALEAEFFRADGVLTRLKVELEHASADYDEAVKALVKACGEGFAPAPTQDKKHLMCQRVTPPPPPAK
jgi:hypothetical protein